MNSSLQKKIAGKVVFPDKITPATITFKNGKIFSIKEAYPSSLSGVEDYRDNYILPGLIEVHGHLREPGFTQKGDVPHETRAAAAGGVTAILDMPNTNPPTTSVELLKEKIEKIYPKRSYIDYAFFIGASRDSLEELEKVDASSIVGVKIFMAGHETTPTTIPDDETLSNIAKILAKRGIILAVHAEDQYLINELNAKFKRTGRTDPGLWSEIRPTEVVAKAAQRAINIAKKHKTKLYLLHLSTTEEFDLVHKAKESGMDVWGEVVGYQLFFNIEDYKKFKNKIKVAPALRTPQVQTKLWELLRSGRIDVLCSEHTPHEWETKNQPDMWKAQSGTPGLQETLPMFLTSWIKRYGKDSIEEALKLVAKHSSYNPAKIFNLKSKGSIEVGKDADFSVIDIVTPWTVKKEDLFSKCGWSSYEGMTLVGRPTATYLRGNQIYKHGKILGDPQGSWISKLQSKSS